jgi:hypothetical protein
VKTKEVKRLEAKERQELFIEDLRDRLVRQQGTLLQPKLSAYAKEYATHQVTYLKGYILKSTAVLKSMDPQR